MPKNINPIRKARLKKYLKNPKYNIKDALIKAGYKPTTANNSGGNKCVKICQEEIAKELKYADITPDLIIKNFEEDRKLAIKKKDYATATRVDELMGKSIAMLTDKTINRTEITLTETERNELQRLRGALVPSIN